MLSKFTSVLEKCQSKHTQERWPHMNAGEKSVYSPDLLKSVGSNASSEESGAGVCGGLVLKTSLNIACGYLKLSWSFFLEN